MVVAFMGQVLNQAYLPKMQTMQQQLTYFVLSEQLFGSDFE